MSKARPEPSQRAPRRPRCLDPSLPTALERETLLCPEWVAETVVREAERFLKADLPPGYVARLAAKAEHLYPRHSQFGRLLRRADGRDKLRSFMRHWMCAFLHRDRSPLGRRLPREYAWGAPLPSGR